MKKYLATGLAAFLVIVLAVVSLILGQTEMTALQTQTLKTLMIICGISIAYCFIVGELTHNYSQMDKLWSLTPMLYVWIIAARGGMKPRLLIFAVIVTLWGLRLTVNFARKGAYRLKFWEGREDYRWSIVKSHPMFRNRFVWTLFDLLFISAYQNLLVLAICLPALASMESTVPLGAVDLAAGGMATAFLMLETVSDEYQWRFHETKRKLIESGKSLSELPEPYALGFNTLGPWGMMRHPNYLGEQGIWLSLYFFVVGAGVPTHGIFHVTFIGSLLLVLLFMGSSSLAENISSGKYPMYEDYIRQVHKYLPLRRYDPSQGQGAAEKSHT